MGQRLNVLTTSEGGVGKVRKWTLDPHPHHHPYGVWGVVRVAARRGSGVGKTLLHHLLETLSLSLMEMSR